jgi:hypothetical protein
MSGLALFRPSPQYDELAKLAQEHFNQDLAPEDRETLQAASRKIPRHVMVGSILGLGLGVYSAVKLRRFRAEIWNALRSGQKPVRVVFADGSSGDWALLPLFVTAFDADFPSQNQYPTSRVMWSPRNGETGRRTSSLDSVVCSWAARQAF